MLGSLMFLSSIISFAYGACYTKNVYIRKEEALTKASSRVKAEEIARK